MKQPARTSISPRNIFLAVLVITVLAETVVMLILQSLFNKNITITEIIIDSSMLAVIVSPFLWLFIVRPLHRTAINELRLQNEFLKTIMDSFGYPFYVIDANDYNVKIVNKAANVNSLSEKTTCYRLAHKKDRPCEDAEHPCPVEIIKGTKKPVTVEHIHHDDDGNTRYFEVHGYPIFDENGSVIQIIEYSVDITERKQAEEELRKSQKEFLEKNEELKQITESLEITNSAIDKEKIELQFALDDISYLLRQVADNKDFGVRFSNPDAALSGHVGKIAELFNNMMDILESQHKELEEAYAELKSAQSRILQQEKMASIGQLAAGVAHEINNPMGFIISNLGSLQRYLDKLSEFIKAQTKAITELGEMTDKVVIRTPESLRLSGDPVARSGGSSPVIARGSERSEETPKQSQDRLGTGSTISKDKIATPEPALSEKTGLLRFARNDRSEGARKDILDQINESRRSLKIDYIIDDLGNLIRESLDGAERVKKIVQDLKSFSRIDEAEYKMADINAGIESTINMVWNELKYKATVKKEYGDIPMTKCNPGQLNQVFMNILVNAAHAIEKQGEITVKTWHEDSNIYVSISDTGYGIPSENLDKIFEPFYTTKEVGKGTGLGLSIAYDIIKKHNGEITVDSAVGRGTTFIVKIPVVN